MVPLTDDDRPLPPPDSPAAREFARRNPGSWLHEIDPFFGSGEDVPPYGIVGAWRIDEAGEITGRFRKNPGYRPSPRVLGFPEPADALDAAVQLVVAGYGADDQAVALLLSSEVLVATQPEGADDSLWVHEIDGIEGIFVFTSQERLPSEPLLEGGSWRTATGSELASSAPDGVDIVVNINGPARWKVPAQRLRAAARP
ncbi:type VII secretion system-associated protein [Actinomadura chibensis]|uniref:type VII secretion system-associated protein n=1 Tax=Actinomadura chibensis TaxID=392828 RepID=UPI0008358B93|nr:type VII secretion system-associated protein [Actinomadura chibensis]